VHHHDKYGTECDSESRNSGLEHSYAGATALLM